MSRKHRIRKPRVAKKERWDGGEPHDVQHLTTAQPMQPTQPAHTPFVQQPCYDYLVYVIQNTIKEIQKDYATKNQQYIHYLATRHLN